jgi:hypothetical protein
VRASSSSILYVKCNQTRHPSRYTYLLPYDSHEAQYCQITSRFDGVIKKLYYEPDDMAKVGKVRTAPSLAGLKVDVSSL